MFFMLDELVISRDDSWLDRGEMVMGKSFGSTARSRLFGARDGAPHGRGFLVAFCIRSALMTAMS